MLTLTPGISPHDRFTHQALAASGESLGAFLVICICMALSAPYELLKFWIALASGEAAAFLGTRSRDRASATLPLARSTTGGAQPLNSPTWPRACRSLRSIAFRSRPLLIRAYGLDFSRHTKVALYHNYRISHSLC